MLILLGGFANIALASVTVVIISGIIAVSTKLDCIFIRESLN
jgi:hypothetical protein